MERDRIWRMEIKGKRTEISGEVSVKGIDSRRIYYT